MSKEIPGMGGPETPENRRPILDNPIKGNDRLEELRQIINTGDATPDEQNEFDLTLDLYFREAGGDKPWRQNPEWYKETEELKKKNQEAREKNA